MKTLTLPFVKELEKGLSSESGGSHLIQAIVGPRQVGKTTSILSFSESYFRGRAIYVSADQVFNSDERWLNDIWREAEAAGRPLIVDEIQKVSSWSEVLKARWDEAKRKKKMFPCVILGSSSLDIQRGLSDSLTGRFRLIRAFHWNVAESAEGYGLSFEEFLKFGGYPGSYEMRNDLKEWVRYVKTSIIGTVVEKDILANQTVKNHALFRQAFDLLVSYPAQEISYTKLLGSLQDRGNTDLLRNYVRLFEGAFLIRALEKYSTSKIRTRTSSPKIIPMAPALSFIGIQDLLAPEERGRVFEALVGAQLIRTEEQVYYWRDGVHEVDFVLQHGRNLYAIEVKSGRRRRGSGHDEFIKRYPKARAVLVTPENYFEFEKAPLEFLALT